MQMHHWMQQLTTIMAFATCGTSYNIAFFVAEGEVTAPAFLREHIDADHPNAITHTAICAKAGRRVTFVQIIDSDEETRGVSASLTRIFAARGAEVTLVQVQLLNGTTKRYNGVSVKGAKDARVNIVRAEIGGDTVVCGARSMLASKYGEFDLAAVYFGDGNRRLDLNYVIRQIPFCLNRPRRTAV